MADNPFQLIDEIAARIHEIHLEIYQSIHVLKDLRFTEEGFERLDALAKELKGLSVSLTYAGYDASTESTYMSYVDRKLGKIIKNREEVLKGSS